MNATKNNKMHMTLVGHLQVFDEPLASLYKDTKTGLYYLFVRIFEDCDESTYLLSNISPSMLLGYMDGQIGLTTIFQNTPVFYYKHFSKDGLDSSHFLPIAKEDATTKLSEDGLDDKFNSQLSCNSVSIRNYVNQNRTYI